MYNRFDICPNCGYSEPIPYSIIYIEETGNEIEIHCKCNSTNLDVKSDRDEKSRWFRFKNTFKARKYTCKCKDCGFTWLHITDCLGNDITFREISNERFK